VDLFNDPSVLAALRGVFRLAVPETVLVAAACVLFLVSTVRPSRTIAGGIALAALALALLTAYFVKGPDDSLATVTALRADRFAEVVRWIALLSGAVLVLVCWDGVPDPQAADYHACLLVSVAGLSLAGAANELVTLFLALEMISIPTYVMLYLPRSDRRGQEAAVKYFLLSILSSAVFLFGLSYLYGLAGTTNITAIHQTVDAAWKSARDAAEPVPGTAGLALTAVVMAVAGLSYRMTAVPFHFYAPDVYQGAATAPVAVLAHLPKVAGFAALIRLLGLTEVGPDHIGLVVGPQVPVLLWILAAITMTVGNALALAQDNIKRMLAYSSVAHGGYLLIGVATVAQEAFLRSGRPDYPGGVDAVLFYLVAYGAMTVGLFAVIACVSTRDRPVEHIDDLAGLYRSHPLLAVLGGLFLFSLIGLPLTAGFSGKLLLFLGAVGTPNPQAGLTPSPLLERLFPLLALIAAVNSAVGAYYYLRVLGVMFLRGAVKPLNPPRRVAGWAAVLACGALTVVFGVYPWPLLKGVRQEARPAAAVTTTSDGTVAQARDSGH
jgi:NADH-quinone oxidoreductase subunit N